MTTESSASVSPNKAASIARHTAEGEAVQDLLESYNDDAFEDALLLLDHSRGTNDIDEWAKAVNVKLRTNPFDEEARPLDKCRKSCLQLLDEMVHQWEACENPKAFEDAIIHVFGIHRIEAILTVCLPLHRARALYRSRGTETKYGTPWVAELHFQAQTPFARDYPQQQQKWIQLRQKCPGGRMVPSMENSLFQLLFNDRFGLQYNPDFQRWSMPAQVPSVMESTSSMASIGSSPSMHTVTSGEQDPIKLAIKDWVKTYDSPKIQTCLEETLHHDLDQALAQGKYTDQWAQEWATTLKDNPADERAKKLNNARKTCLGLVFNLVDDWAACQYSPEFEQQMEHIFHTRRLERILSVCLPMDRAQCLYKMRLSGSDQVGMPWYCALHLEPDNAFARDHKDKHLEWIKFSWNYSGRPSMNKRLFRILFSDQLQFQTKKEFRNWSMPCDVPGKATVSEDAENWNGSEQKTIITGDYQKIMDEMAVLKTMMVQGFSQNQDMHQEQMKELKSISQAVNRSMRALALLSVSQVKKCPNLVYLVPAPGTVEGRGPTSWVSGVAKQKYHLYFVCQHTVKHGEKGANPCLEQPMELWLARSWLAKVAPALKLGILALKAVALTYGFPFPMSNVQLDQQFYSMEQFVGDCLDTTSAAVIAGCEGAFTRGDLDFDSGELTELIGPSYDLIAKTAHEPKHQFWKDLIYPVIDEDGSTIWVKKEYALNIYSKNRLCFPKPDNLKDVKYPDGINGDPPVEQTKEVPVEDATTVTMETMSLGGAVPDPSSAELIVTVRAGRNLVAKDGNLLGKKVTSDPYVAVALGPNKMGKTAHKRKTLEPSWADGNVFRLSVGRLTLEKHTSVVCEVWDYDMLSKDDAMGTVYVEVPISTPNKRISRWYPVEEGEGTSRCKNPSGELLLDVELRAPEGFTSSG